MKRDEERRSCEWV